MKFGQALMAVRFAFDLLRLVYWYFARNVPVCQQFELNTGCIPPEFAQSFLEVTFLLGLQPHHNFTLWLTGSRPFFMQPATVINFLVGVNLVFKMFLRLL